MSISRTTLIFAALLGCGTFTGFALIFSSLWPFAFVTLVALLFASTKYAPSATRAFFYGSTWGFGLMAVSQSFVFAALPIDWLGVSMPVVGGMLVAFTWIFVSSVLAISIGFFGALAWLMRREAPVMQLSILPLLWVALEVVRATVSSLFILGPGTSIGPFYSFGYLGYTMAGAKSLLAIAPLGGPLFLSGVIVLLNVGLYIALHHRGWGIAHAGGCCAAVVASLLLLNAVLPPVVHVSVGASRVALFDTQVLLMHTDERASFIRPEEVQAAQNKDLAARISEALTMHPDARVVVLPEDRRFTAHALERGTEEEQAAVEALAAKKMLLIDSARITDGAVAREILYAHDFGRGVSVQTSAKSYLTPFGEYVPHLALFVARMLGHGKAAETLAQERSSYVPGPWDPVTRIVQWEGISYGLLSCSELFSTKYVHDLAQFGADVIVVMSSQSWVQNDSPLLFNQMLGMAIVDTAWTGKPYLQATNNAPNVVIMPVR